MGPLQDVSDDLRNAAEGYVESERERWEETMELGPVGTFKRGFRQGLTGPAPTLDEDGSVDFGPGPFDWINRTGYDGAGGDSESAEEPNPLLIAVGGIALLSVVAIAAGQLFTVEL